jgi:RimJ/RimL family protein N-acetyltransferase
MTARVMARSERLVLAHLVSADAPWIVTVLDNPEFRRFVGDRGVHSTETAEQYLANGPLASYAQHGFGLWGVTLRDSGMPVGIAGVLRRPELSDPDIGYAVLPAMRGQGYAIEAAGMVLALAHGALGIDRVLAIVDPENTASCTVLSRLGFRREGPHAAPGSDHRLDRYAHP